ncbi:MAG: hypothetical protein M5U34_25675 [Chloroflexi bacterium]|nr:hypothetical protein [Chloroflexota bacterium]
MLQQKLSVGYTLVGSLAIFMRCPACSTRSLATWQTGRICAGLSF